MTARALIAAQYAHDHALPEEDRECGGEPPCFQCGHRHQCEAWAEKQMEEREDTQ